MNMSFQAKMLRGSAILIIYPVVMLGVWYYLLTSVTERVAETDLAGRRLHSVMRMERVFLLRQLAVAEYRLPETATMEDVADPSLSLAGTEQAMREALSAHLSLVSDAAVARTASTDMISRLWNDYIATTAGVEPGVAATSEEQKARLLFGQFIVGMLETSKGSLRQRSDETVNYTRTAGRTLLVVIAAVFLCSLFIFIFAVRGMTRRIRLTANCLVEGVAAIRRVLEADGHCRVGSFEQDSPCGLLHVQLRFLDVVAKDMAALGGSRVNRQAAAPGGEPGELDDF